jgi:hypothetical protein
MRAPERAAYFAALAAELARLRAEEGEGMCMAGCGRRLRRRRPGRRRPGREPVVCPGDPECARVYGVLYKLASRIAQKRAAAPQTAAEASP